MKSFNTFDNEIREFVLQNCPAKDTPILDVGAGSGKFRKLLFDYTTIDAVEIHGPYIKEYNLKDMYNEVWHRNIMGMLQRLDDYPLMILGDVLEHLVVFDAQILLRAFTGTVIVCIPYEYPQEAVNDNLYETHIQDDLTHEIFMDRYEGFKLLVHDDKYGVYVKGPGIKSIDALKQPKINVWDVDKEQFKDVHLCIATPVSESCSVAYTQSLATSMKRLTEMGIKCALAMVAGHSVQQARNRLVAAFMSNPEFTHLMFIDSDHGWKVQNILRLLAMDRDMIGVIARKKTPEVQWAANIPNGQLRIDRGALSLGEDGEIGTGFILIKRTVFEQMFVAYPELKIDHPDKEKVSQGERDSYYVLFQYFIVGGVERSEDLTFCRRWKAIGGTIWADPNAAISHIGIYDFKGSVSTLFKEKLEDVV